jgi:GNAT superfamily N-acetyltransferase
MPKSLTVRPTQQEFVRRGLSVRPITPEDEEFLYTLYASSREEELSRVDWDTALKEQFLRMQFRAQHQFYHQHFVEPEFLIILLRAKSIGRIYIDRRQNELTLAEITLLPEYRDRGIGSVFIQDLMAEALEKKLPVRLHVEHFNRSRRLYDRLGFQLKEDKGVYFHLEWLPETAATPF